MFIEFGPGPIYAHGSSFLPNTGIIIMMIMVSRAEIRIIIVNRIIIAIRIILPTSLLSKRNI